jgi:phosphate transport system ATP-binding protein
MSAPLPAACVGPSTCRADPVDEPIGRLSVRGLTVRYGDHRALEDVDLELAAGRITALVGPSGCGKSTFLQTLNRLTDLIPGCRVEGSVRLDGAEILDPRRDLLALRRRVGMIFQKPNPFPLSIRRNFALPLREHGVRDPAEIEARTERALRAVGLWDEVASRLERAATALSGGQQQRLCIARALVLEPEVILLDEPCAALDPLSSATVEDLIASLRERYTVVVVTHNLPQARRLADHTALFGVAEGAGRVVEVADTGTFFADPRHPLARDYVAGVRG